MAVAIEKKVELWYTLEAGHLKLNIIFPDLKVFILYIVTKQNIEWPSIFYVHSLMFY